MHGDKWCWKGVNLTTNQCNLTIDDDDDDDDDDDYYYYYYYDDDVVMMWWCDDDDDDADDDDDDEDDDTTTLRCPPAFSTGRSSSFKLLPSLGSLQTGRRTSYK